MAHVWAMFLLLGPSRPDLCVLVTQLNHCGPRLGPVSHIHTHTYKIFSRTTGFFQVWNLENLEILFSRVLLGKQANFRASPSNEQATKRPSFLGYILNHCVSSMGPLFLAAIFSASPWRLGYKIKPLWPTFGPCFYCWDLLG